MASDSGAKIYDLPRRARGELRRNPALPHDSEGQRRGTQESRVLEVMRARNVRRRFLSPMLLSDPAWDMLLALYAAELGRRALTCKRLCFASAAPAPVAHRYIRMLVAQGLAIIYEAKGTGAESVRLSRKGADAMESYFDYLNADEFPDVIAPGRLRRG